MSKKSETDAERARAIKQMREWLKPGDTLLAGQAFINIGAMLGLLPLTGVPLPFISHGGTALLFALIEVGIILSISRHNKT